MNECPLKSMDGIDVFPIQIVPFFKGKVVSFQGCCLFSNGMINGREYINLGDFAT